LIEKIEATPASLFPPDELPPINYFSRAGRREWQRELARKGETKKAQADHEGP
jgi:hypothetical protein